MPKQQSSPKEKSAKQEAFERDAREKLENADMEKFDETMRKVIRASQSKNSNRKLKSPDLIWALGLIH